MVFECPSYTVNFPAFRWALENVLIRDAKPEWKKILDEDGGGVRTSPKSMLSSTLLGVGGVKFD